MSHWQDRFLGIGDLPPELSIFELDFFQFSDKDLAAIREAFRPKYRIAVAIQLGFMRLTGGRLNTFKVLPRNLLKIVGDQVGQTPPSIASLRSLYVRTNTRREHQAWVMEWLGINSHSKRQERMLLAAIREAAKGTASVDRLIAIARQWLFDKLLLVPAESTLRDICIRAVSDNEAAMYEAICKAVPSDQLAAWMDAMFEMRSDGRTNLEWLQRAPKKRSQKNLRDLFDKIDYLTELGVASIDLSTVSSERQADYARRLQHRRPSRFRSLSEMNQTLHLVSFLRVTLSHATDAVVHLAGKMTSDVVSRASQDVKRAQGTRLVSYRDILRDIFGLVEDPRIDAETLRSKLQEKSKEFAPFVFPSQAAAVRARLTDKIPAIRPLLRKLVKLDIKGLPNERATQGLSELQSLYERKVTELPKGEYHCAEAWKKLIDEDADRERALRALEMSTLFELRRGFRRGSCWINYSASYRDRDQLLIPPDRWALQRRRHLGMLRLPEKPDHYIATLVEAVKNGLDAVAQALARGELSVDGGDIHLPKLEAESLPPGVNDARDAIAEAIGEIQLPELLLEMDQHTRFSKTLLGRAPESERELLLTYGALLAHGTEMNATGISLMMPGISATDISAAMKSLELDDAVGKANILVREFIGRLPVTKLWGDGKTASSDMMSLPTSRHLWNARLDPRRRTPSIGIYTHVHNQWPIIYNQPIVLGERQAGAAIEGVVRQLEIELDRLAVDTHGYTDVAMCISRLLGFDLCPRLKDLSERRLTIPRGMSIPEALKDVIDATLNIDFVTEHWDELLRIAASISNGTVNANLVLQRYGSAAQGDPLYRAAQTLGRLIRTLYLCDYFTKPEFRREIHRILNRGESVHTLQRAIHYGEIPHDRGRRSDELITISGSLTLLTNLVIGWTALKTQDALAALSSRGVSFAPDVMRHVSPVRYANVNFRGTFRFPVEKYRALLLGELGNRYGTRSA